MNLIFILFALLNIINLSHASINRSNNSSIKLRNASLKFIIFKEKEIPKMIKYLKNKYDYYYDKTIIKIYENVNKYENLSEEDKILLDFMFSLIIS
jgi:hypothetical protein